MAIQQFTGVSVAMSTSGNEYSIAIPAGATNLQIRLREGSTNTMKVYKVSVGNGGTPLNAITVTQTTPLALPGKFGGQTLYLMPNANSLNAEAAYIADS